MLASLPFSCPGNVDLQTMIYVFKMKLTRDVVLQFADDVYLPTDEPHGSIQASLSRFWSKM